MRSNLCNDDIPYTHQHMHVPYERSHNRNLLVFEIKVAVVEYFKMAADCVEQVTAV